ncbi:MAG: preprotein translocase subunit SecG [Fimbriimonadaceae bacterium]|nr:preprotein translocase subunit SecG [Fimbriimonadaceae bacterium]
MQVAYNILLGLALVCAVVFIMLVFVTGKGDAMSSGGTAVRTTFRGKASFDDQISKVTIYLGGGFMLLMLVLDFIGHHLNR